MGLYHSLLRNIFKYMHHHKLVSFHPLEIFLSIGYSSIGSSLPSLRIFYKYEHHHRFIPLSLLKIFLSIGVKPITS